MFTYVSVITICIKVQYSRQKKQTTFSIVYFAQNFIPHRPKAGKKKKKVVYISITKLHKLLITVFEYVIDTQIPPEHMCMTGTDTRI